MSTFDRIPVILYVLILNLLFVPFIGISLSFYVVQKCLPEITYMDVGVLILFCIEIALPYILGEMLYQGGHFLKSHVTNVFITKLMSAECFSRITRVLFFVLTIVSILGGVMLNSDIERSYERNRVEMMRQRLNNVSIQQLRERGEETLASIFPEGYDEVRLLWANDFVVVQVAGKDRCYDTEDDIILLKK